MAVSDEKMKDEIGAVLMGMVKRFDAEIVALTEEQLESRWFFRYEDKMSTTWNMYKFYDCLTMYASACRRWEEHHNGSCCVVERTRDKYIFPKIRAFEALLKTKAVS